MLSTCDKPWRLALSGDKSTACTPVLSSPSLSLSLRVTASIGVPGNLRAENALKESGLFSA